MQVFVEISCQVLIFDTYSLVGVKVLSNVDFFEER